MRVPIALLQVLLAHPHVSRVALVLIVLLDKALARLARLVLIAAILAQPHPVYVLRVLLERIAPLVATSAQVAQQGHIARLSARLPCQRVSRAQPERLAVLLVLLLLLPA